MSYILDALRKADSERERGAVPGIHAQPVAVASDDAPASNWVVWRPWLIGAAFVALLAVVAWLVLERDAAPAAPNLPCLPTAAPSAQTSVAPAVPAVPAVPSAPAVPVVPPATAVAPAPAPAVAPPPAPPRLASAAPAPAERKPPPVAARKAVPSAPAAVASGTAGSAPKGGAIPADANAGGRILALNELPEEVRRELPPLPIGGSIYSKTPSARLLIINGQLFHENDELAPGLVLEQIKLKAAVLRFKGYRYEVGF